MTWKAGKITVDEGVTVVDGEYRTDVRWNGWLCPRMQFDAVEQVLRAIAQDAPDDCIIMLGENDYYRYFVAYDLNDEGSGYEVEVFVPDLHGWYSPGYMGWCWEDAEPWIRLQQEQRDFDAEMEAPESW